MTLGEKIKNYRKAKGLSQLQLETGINASNGMISRIESGQINPTKETILNIAKALKLNGVETADLFALDLELLHAPMQIANKLGELKHPEEIMQATVDEISRKLEYASVAIFMLDETGLRAMYMENSKFRAPAFKIFGGPLYTLHTTDPENLLLKCAREGKIYESSDIIQFGRGALSDWKLRQIEKLISMKSGIAVPMITNGKSIGCIFLSRANAESYSNEIVMLQSVAAHVAIVLARSMTK